MLPLVATGNQATALGNVATSPAGLAVIKLYDSILLRNPSTAELDLRSVSQLRHGLSLTSLQNSLFASTERTELLRETRRRFAWYSPAICNILICKHSASRARLSG